LSQKLGILGGTFNPIHIGHLVAAEEVRDRLQLDRVLFIPAYAPPHKDDENIPSAKERMEMVDLAVSGNTFFEPSDIEMKRGGMSYSIETIEELRRIYPGSKLCFIIGLDAFLEIQTWHRWKELMALCDFAVMSRRGRNFSDLRLLDFMANAADVLRGLDKGSLTQANVQHGAATVHLVTIPLLDISSTDIRTRVKQGSSIKYLLPEPVEHYIIKKKLYV
jgi:nicotinate-nucleotide adenylyltransferase